MEGVAPSLHLGVAAIEKGAFEPLSTTVANFTYVRLHLFSLVAHLSKNLCKFPLNAFRKSWEDFDEEQCFE